MSANEVMAQIMALPAPEKARLAKILAEETDWLDDLLDTAVVRARMNEPERPVEMLLREQRLVE